MKKNMMIALLLSVVITSISLAQTQQVSEPTPTAASHAANEREPGLGE